MLVLVRGWHFLRIRYYYIRVASELHFATHDMYELMSVRPINKYMYS